MTQTPYSYVEMPQQAVRFVQMFPAYSSCDISFLGETIPQQYALAGQHPYSPKLSLLAVRLCVCVCTHMMPPWHGKGTGGGGVVVAKLVLIYYLYSTYILSLVFWNNTQAWKGAISPCVLFQNAYISRLPSLYWSDIR